MRSDFLFATMVAGAFVLAGCNGGGGGGGPDAPPASQETANNAANANPSSQNNSQPSQASIYGTAAIGRAISGQITFINADGSQQVQTVTGSSGSFTLASGTFNGPVLIKAEDSVTGAKLYSIAFKAGTANINPVTDAVLRFLAKDLGVADGKVETMFSTPALRAKLNDTVVGNALTAVMSRLDVAALNALQANGAYLQNPFTDTYQIGDALDKWIDQFQPVTNANTGGISTLPWIQASNGVTLPNPCALLTQADAQQLVRSAPIAMSMPYPMEVRAQPVPAYLADASCYYQFTPTGSDAGDEATLRPGIQITVYAYSSAQTPALMVQPNPSDSPAYQAMNGAMPGMVRTLHRGSTDIVFSWRNYAFIVKYHDDVTPALPSVDWAQYIGPVQAFAQQAQIRLPGYYD